MGTATAGYSCASLLSAFGEKYQLDDLVDFQTKLWRFFLNRKDLKPIRPPHIFTNSNLWRWRALNLLPVYFPSASIIWETLLGSRAKPWIKFHDEFYQMIEENPADRYQWQCLREGWCLADLTPACDFLTDRDRIGGVLVNYCGSRVGLSANYWESDICPLIEDCVLRRRPDGWCRIERAIEYNVMCNAFDAERQRFHVCEWLHESLVVGDPTDSQPFRRIMPHLSHESVAGVAARPIICFPTG